MKALAAGVPLVLLPHGRDQADTAVRVSARGAGVIVKRSAGVDGIAKAVRRVLENHSYRTMAQRLGETILRDAESDQLVHGSEDVDEHGQDDASPCRITGGDVS